MQKATLREYGTPITRPRANNNNDLIIIAAPAAHLMMGNYRT
jgi:hypothetical protein